MVRGSNWVHVEALVLVLVGAIKTWNALLATMERGSSGIQVEVQLL
jgi:hypothetical protein